MKKVISFTHISLDGFVAGPNGQMNWIKINEEIFDHVGKRISRGDAALYGRVTFQMMEAYWPTAADKPNATQHDIQHARWYAGARKIVLSRTLKEADFTNTTIISDNLPERIRELKEQPGEEILLFGSPTATHALMAHGLIDGYWLFVNPVVLGRGMPLFDGSQGSARLELVGTRRFACGVVELSYVVEGITDNGER
jgi:dihydrofolate reductase